uniref:Uncharacterized protein n=1 Tax=candidate division WWE3 bacterium TaxID=2053526 RepID=A0A831Z018_UNCKA
MAEIVNYRDLEGFKILALESGGFFIAASCPICGGTVALHLTAHDLETNRQIEIECRSGKDWPKFFQLHARYSPDETDDESGVDVWGEIFESPEQEED